jgi:DNA-binding NarL/FixJ family response regulator
MAALPALAYAQATLAADVSVSGGGRDTLVAVSQAGSRAGNPGGLTARELEVLRQLASGRSNREIAERLTISERTVEHHIANIYGKIAARGRVDATSFAYRHGLLGD